MSSHIAVLEQNVADLTGKIGSPQLLSASQTDPITTKKIADVDDKCNNLKDTIKGLLDDVRSLRSSISQDKTMLETSISAKLEQYVTYLVKEKCANMNQDILSQTKTVFQDYVTQQQDFSVQIKTLVQEQIQQSMQELHQQTTTEIVAQVKLIVQEEMRNVAPMIVSNTIPNEADEADEANEANEEEQIPN